FYGSYFSYIEPGDMFGFDRSISWVLMGVIGGIGTIAGPALGAIIFVLLRQYLIASYPQLYLGLYGVLLVLVILFQPLGLTGFAGGRAGAEGGGIGSERELTGLPAFKVARAGVVRTHQIVRPFANLSLMENCTVAAVQCSGRDHAGARALAREMLQFVGLESR